MTDEDQIRIEEEVKARIKQEQEEQEQEQLRKEAEKESKKLEQQQEEEKNKKNDIKNEENPSTVIESHIIGNSTVTSTMINEEDDEDSGNWITPNDIGYIPPIENNFVNTNKKNEDKGIVGMTTGDFYMQVLIFIFILFIECVFTNGNENIII